eukprot:gnl/TRDRNA2_/TRDRNA2_160632_c0_seq1.p1 gnl/TRDRNA2_/TRDRNA2_160632_c0~~gnl/TRDRNA2_/TRDRNA2_160632_c0_seq1.p1  ORF type:complete len:269 (-),score=29.77 gnl/TRDRNA2_/TRDRNA2_160632_c0_seq1:155-859(-)
MDWKPITASDGSEPDVSFPGKIAVGSSRAMHQDTRFDAAGKFEQTVIQGYISVLYLQGGGRLLFDFGFGEHAIEAKPGRLVVWLNESCKHQVECSPDGRARSLLGPMYISPQGIVQAVGHMGTRMEAYNRTYALDMVSPPSPKLPDVIITLTNDDGMWSCTVMSGNEVARIPCRYKTGHFFVYHSVEELRHLVFAKLSNREVNVVLLADSGGLLTDEAVKSVQHQLESTKLISL